MLPPKYKIKAEAAAQTKIIINLLDKCDEVCNAGDPDQKVVSWSMKFYGM
jgi:DNA topoisomerase-3